jgi:hypothetical protein
MQLCRLRKICEDKNDKYPISLNRKIREIVYLTRHGSRQYYRLIASQVYDVSGVSLNKSPPPTTPQNKKKTFLELVKRVKI